MPRTFKPIQLCLGLAMLAMGGAMIGVPVVEADTLGVDLLTMPNLMALAIAGIATKIAAGFVIVTSH